MREGTILTAGGTLGGFDPFVGVPRIYRYEAALSYPQPRGGENGPVEAA